jgi:hypothetical protein
MSLILLAEVWMPCMVCTTSPITAPPRSATSALRDASEAASRVLLTVLATVAVISSIELAVFCSCAAVSSVRWARSDVLPDN